MLTDRERYFRGVLHVQPVIPSGQPVAQAAMRISDEHDFVRTTHAGDGHRSRTKPSVVAASCIELKLQASWRLHAISVSPGIDAGDLSHSLYPAAAGPETSDPSPQRPRIATAASAHPLRNAEASAPPTGSADAAPDS
jgi:hypothetical protein